VCCSATDDDVVDAGGVVVDVDVTVGGVVSVVRSVSSSCAGTDAVEGVSPCDEPVEPQDCNERIETSEMVSRPARCLAMDSAYLLIVRELSRPTSVNKGEGCVDRRALCEQKVNNDLEPQIRLALAF
jgi:hypothetical protein